jgi:hypothetical protein
MWRRRRLAKKAWSLGGRGRFQCPPHHSPGLLVFTTKIGEQTSDDGLRRVDDGMQDVPVTSLKLGKCLSFLPAPGSDTCCEQLSIRQYSPAETSHSCSQNGEIRPRTNNCPKLDRLAYLQTMPRTGRGMRGHVASLSASRPRRPHDTVLLYYCTVRGC